METGSALQSSMGVPASYTRHASPSMFRGDDTRIGSGHRVAHSFQVPAVEQTVLLSPIHRPNYTRIPTFSDHNTNVDDHRELEHRGTTVPAHGTAVSYNAQQSTFNCPKPQNVPNSSSYHGQTSSATILPGYLQPHPVRHRQSACRADNIQSLTRSEHDAVVDSVDWLNMLYESRGPARSQDLNTQSADVVSSLDANTLPPIENYLNLLSPVQAKTTMASQGSRKTSPPASTGASPKAKTPPNTPLPTRGSVPHPAIEALPDLFKDVPTPGFSEQVFKHRRRFLLPIPTLLFTIDEEWAKHVIRAPALIHQLRAACRARLEMSGVHAQRINALADRYIMLLFDKAEEELLLAIPEAPIVRDQSRLEQQYRYLSGGLWREIYPDYKDTDGARERIARVSCNFRAMEWQIEILESWISHVKQEVKSVAEDEDKDEAGRRDRSRKDKTGRPVFGPQRRPGRPPGTRNKSVASKPRKRAISEVDSSANAQSSDNYIRGEDENKGQNQVPDRDEEGESNEKKKENPSGNEDLSMTTPTATPTATRIAARTATPTTNPSTPTNPSLHSQQAGSPRRVRTRRPSPRKLEQDL